MGQGSQLTTSTRCRQMLNRLFPFSFAFCFFPFFRPVPLFFFFQFLSCRYRNVILGSSEQDVPILAGASLGPHPGMESQSAVVGSSARAQVHKVLRYSLNPYVSMRVRSALLAFAALCYSCAVALPEVKARADLHKALYRCLISILEATCAWTTGSTDLS